MARRAGPAPPSTRSAEANLARLGGGTSLVFGAGWVAYLLALVFNIVVARRVSPDAYGAFALGLAILSILTGLAPLGMDQTIVRYVAIYRGQGEPQRVRGLVRLGVRITLIGGLLLGAALFLAAGPATRLFHAGEVAPVLRVLAFAVPLTATTDLLLGTVQAHTRVVSTVLVRSFTIPAVRLVGGIGALLIARDVVGVAVAYTLGEVMALGLAAFAARRILPGKEVGPAIRPAAEVTRFAWPLALNRVVSSVSNKTETLFLAGLGSVGAVALLAAARRFTGVSSSIFRAFSVLFNPMASDLNAAGQQEQLAAVYKTVGRWVFSVGLPVFLVQLLFGRALLGAFGSHFRTAEAALIILACGQLVNYASGTAGMMLLNIGRSRLALVNSTAALVLSLLIDPVLISRYGLIGAAVGSAVTLAGLQIARVVEVYWLTRMHPYSAGFAKPIAAGLAAAGVSRLGVPLLSSGGTGKLLSIAAFLATYVVVMVGLGIDGEDRLVLRRVLKRVRRSGPGAQQIQSVTE